MNAPESPHPAPPGLVEMHGIMLALLQTSRADDRAQLANDLVGHPAFFPRLKTASGVFLKSQAQHVDLLEDVQQGASLILIERLTAGSMAYQDQGILQFGGWIYMACLTTCADALKTCLPLWLQSIELIGTIRLESVMARLEVEHSLDAVFRAIASIQDPVLREVMFDFIEKMTLRESAARHKLSPSTIFRLRRKGLLQVRRFVREELAAAVH